MTIWNLSVCSSHFDLEYGIKQNWFFSQVFRGEVLVTILCVCEIGWLVSSCGGWEKWRCCVLAQWRLMTSRSAHCRPVRRASHHHHHHHGGNQDDDWDELERLDEGKTFEALTTWWECAACQPPLQLPPRGSSPSGWSSSLQEPRPADLSPLQSPSFSSPKSHLLAAVVLFPPPICHLHHHHTAHHQRSHSLAWVAATTRPSCCHFTNSGRQSHMHIYCIPYKAWSTGPFFARSLANLTLIAWQRLICHFQPFSLLVFFPVSSKNGVFYEKGAATFSCMMINTKWLECCCWHVDSKVIFGHLGPFSGHNYFMK